MNAKIPPPSPHADKTLNPLQLKFKSNKIQKKKKKKKHRL